MSALEKGLLLHIGLSKTGTTTLQRSLFANHPEIYYFGKDFLSNFPNRCRSQDIYDFLRPLIWDISRPLDIDRYRAILKEKILPEVDPGKFLVASWEGLASSSIKKYSEKINRLQSIFGTYRIMVTIRNPLSWIPSLYLQNIRGHFIHQNRPWMGKLPYIDIDEWFEKRISIERSLDTILSYTRNIQRAVNLLGMENVGVFVFEELLDDPDRYYRNICDFIGIDVAKGLELTRQKCLNKRITEDQLEILQRISRSRWSRLMLRLKGRPYRKRIFMRNADDGIPAKVTLPRQFEKRISDAARDGNRWITENFSLHLEKYNYPL